MTEKVAPRVLDSGNWRLLYRVATDAMGAWVERRGGFGFSAVLDADDWARLPACEAVLISYRPGRREYGWPNAPGWPGVSPLDLPVSPAWCVFGVGLGDMPNEEVRRWGT